MPLEDGREPFGDAFELLLADRTAQAVFRQRGQVVLLYQLLSGMVLFVGSARVAGFTIAEGGRSLWQFERFQRFAAPVVSTLEASSPSARRLLKFTPERFGEILSQGEIVPATPGDAEADGTRLAVDDAYLRVHQRVLEAWNFRCALTGRSFPPSAGLHRHLTVVPIRPRDSGGPLHVRNYLPAVEPAGRAFVNGVVSVGPGLDLLVVPDRIDPDVFASLRRDGRLLIPDDRELGPDPVHLDYHRIHVFASGGVPPA
jgi:hypothetical protein